MKEQNRQIPKIALTLGFRPQYLLSRSKTELGHPTDYCLRTDKDGLVTISFVWQYLSLYPLKRAGITWRMVGLLLTLATTVLSGCASSTVTPEPPAADANSCFLRAVNLCETPGCINNQLKLCDAQLSNASMPMTEGIRTTLIKCFVNRRTTTAAAGDSDYADEWRRCMHLLDATTP